MYKNSKKQGDAGLGQAIAHFTELGYDVALPLTDSADWDMIVEIDGILKRVQVKTSSQLRNDIEVFDASVKGGNKSSSSIKTIDQQSWDLIFLYHIGTKRKALIPKESLTTNGQISFSEKYKEFILDNGDAVELESGD
jgi:hypothetical protein